MQTVYKFSEVELAHIEKIRQWASDRNLLDASNTMKQLGKTYEELGELVRAGVEDDESAALDALGDVWVTLIIGALQNNFEFEPEEHFYDNYAKYYVKIAQGFIAPASVVIMAIGDLSAGILRGTTTKQQYLEALNLLKMQFEEWLDESIETVWEVISKRTGKTVDGVFIKAEDLVKD